MNNTLIDLLSPLLYVVILMIIILYKRCGVRKMDVIFIFLLCILAVYIVSTRLIRHLYYLCIVCIMVTVFIIMIVSSRIPKTCKIVIITLILSVYHKTIMLVTLVVCTSIKIILSSKNNKNDETTSSKIKSILNVCGFRLVTNFDSLPRKPTIFLANYCRDRAENPACLLLPRKLAVLMADGFKHVNMAGIINKPIYVTVNNKGNFEYVQEQIKIAHDEGNDLFVYGNSPSYFDYMTRYKTGIFKIAKKLNITVTPVAIDYIHTNWGTIPSQNFFMKTGNQISVDNPDTARYLVRKFHLKCHEIFKREKFKRGLTTI